MAGAVVVGGDGGGGRGAAVVHQPTPARGASPDPFLMSIVPRQWWSAMAVGAAAAAVDPGDVLTATENRRMKNNPTVLDSIITGMTLPFSADGQVAHQLPGAVMAGLRAEPVETYALARAIRTHPGFAAISHRASIHT